MPIKLENKYFREYYLNNKSKLDLYKKNWYIENKDKIQTKRKLYRLKNKDKIRKCKRDYYLKNKYSIKLKQKKYYSFNRDKIYAYVKNKLNNDINYKLSHSLRRRMNNALKNTQKCGSAIKDLGCSIEYFKNYIESKFLDGMRWNNYGKGGWHLDHIIPLSSFNLSNRTQFLKSCNYTNFQPLWAIDNISKGNKI